MDAFNSPWKELISEGILLVSDQEMDIESSPSSVYSSTEEEDFNAENEHLIIRASSIPKYGGFFPQITKIVGTLGLGSQSVADISRCLEAGMSVARFDFTERDDPEYHQKTFDNLMAATRSTNKLCAVMLDTVGPQLQVLNPLEKTIQLQEAGFVLLTPHRGQEASSELFPINYDGLAKAVKEGDTISVGQYLFTGSERAIVMLEVVEIEGGDVRCKILNSAILAGSRFSLHASEVHIDLPALSDKDKKVISTWGVKNKIDFLSLSYTQHAQDVCQAREYLSTLGDLSQTKIFAKIENMDGLAQIENILKEADGIIFSCEKMGMGFPPKVVLSYLKTVLHRCNMAGKPTVVAVVTPFVENITEAATFCIVNAVLEGSDAILLDAETSNPVDTISIVSKTCVKAEEVFNQEKYFYNTVKYVGESMSDVESRASSVAEDVFNQEIYFDGTIKYDSERMRDIESKASSVVRAATENKESLILCFTSSGGAARLIAKYRPTMPVLTVFVPRAKSNLLEVRQSLIIRGIFPVPAGPLHAGMSTRDTLIKRALDHAKAAGVINSHDRVVLQDCWSR